MFNSLQHSPAKIKEILVELCKERGIQSRGGEYQIRISVCKEYFKEIFDNLPVRTIETLLDNLILSGFVYVKRGSRSKECYIIIPDKDFNPATREVEEPPPA